MCGEHVGAIGDAQPIRPRGDAQSPERRERDGEISRGPGCAEHTDARRRPDRVDDHRRIAGAGAEATHAGETAVVDLQQIGAIVVRDERDARPASRTTATARAPRPSTRASAGAIASTVQPACCAASRIAAMSRADAAAATTGAGAPRRDDRAGNDAPTICGAARRHEVARRVAREHALELVVARSGGSSSRRTSVSGGISETASRLRPLACDAERARELGERDGERRPVPFVSRRRIERHAPRASPESRSPDVGRAELRSPRSRP